MINHPNLKIKVKTKAIRNNHKVKMKRSNKLNTFNWRLLLLSKVWMNTRACLDSKINRVLLTKKLNRANSYDR